MNAGGNQPNRNTFDNLCDTLQDASPRWRHMVVWTLAPDGRVDHMWIESRPEERSL